MSCDPKYERLCRLINGSLLPYYTEPQPTSLTKEKERNLLIALSQISREIRSWENLQDCDSQGVGLNSGAEDHHNCLASILSLLVTFFTVESRHVRHSAGNVLMIISNLLADTGEDWSLFLRYLCLCLEVALCNIISSQPVSSMTGQTDLDNDTISFILSVRQGLVNANWNTTACLVQVLRSILKHMMQDCSSELVERYMQSISGCLSHIPWGMLSGNHAGETSEARTSPDTDILYLENIGSAESRFLFLGALLQFFCSLTQQSSSIEARGGSLDKNGLLDIITNLVPKLLRWCIHKQGHYDRAYISQYLRHKMLMLMIRLSSQIHWECSNLLLWLQLIRTYFDDLLLQPISGHPTGIKDSLEGSPFQADVVHEHKICTPHLQRQAIFLFLKCSFSLINLSEEADTECLSAATTSCLTWDLQYDEKYCNRKRAMSSLSEWLERHLHLESSIDYGMYSERCRSFTKSFLQMYMEEDDFLFEVLLQFWSVPSTSKFVQARETKEREKAFKDAHGDIIFHLSNIFNPIHLFHLFLAELHYDHVVLLDYLISKDTGIHCVQYLLRCFRTVINSWHTFMGFSLDEVDSQSSCKKRKFSEDGLDSQRIDPSCALVLGDMDNGVRHNECKRYSKSGGVPHNMRQRAFENAKVCLLSLKRSVENLHQKNLFPYNPTALLRIFTSFQDLCHRQVKV